MGRSEVATRTVTIGTIDLRDFCGCPNPCEECCNNQCGCTGLPDTLYCSLEDGDIGGCACVAGASIALVWNEATSKWNGSGAFGGCGKTVSLSFYCGPGGVDCSDWLLSVSFSDGCQPDRVHGSDPGCSCDPFEITFSDINLASCCPPLGPASAKFIVTF